MLKKTVSRSREKPRRTGWRAALNAPRHQELPQELKRADEPAPPSIQKKADLLHPWYLFAVNFDKASFTHAFADLLLAIGLWAIFWTISTVNPDLASGRVTQSLSEKAPGILIQCMYVLVAAIYLSAFVHFFARLFGGEGIFKRQFFFYCMYAAPFMIAYLLLLAVNSNFSQAFGSVRVLFVNLYILGLAVFAMAVSVNALKVAHGLSTLRALLATVLGLACAFAFFFMALNANVITI